MAKISVTYNLDISTDSEWLLVTSAQSVGVTLVHAQEVGDFRCGPDYFTDRENLPSYLIKLCLSGCGKLEYEGQNYDIGPGQLFWVDCENRQRYETDPSVGNWRVLWVHFYGGCAQAYYDLYRSMNGSSPVVDIRDDLEIHSLLSTLLSVYRNGNNTLQDDIRASGVLTQLMIRCVAAAGPEIEESHIPGYVAEAKSYIDDNFAQSVTLDVLSQEISINKYYLQKLFKRTMGVSPNEYLIYVRLRHAKQMLRATEKPIAEIAATVGILNIGHFISQFKKHEGVTPRDYRSHWSAASSIPMLDTEE